MKGLNGEARQGGWDGSQFMGTIFKSRSSFRFLSALHKCLQGLITITQVQFQERDPARVLRNKKKKGKEECSEKDVKRRREKWRNKT